MCAIFYLSPSPPNNSLKCLQDLMNTTTYKIVPRINYKPFCITTVSKQTEKLSKVGNVNSETLTFEAMISIKCNELPPEYYSLT